MLTELFDTLESRDSLSFMRDILLYHTVYSCFFFYCSSFVLLYTFIIWTFYSSLAFSCVAGTK